MARIERFDNTVSPAVLSTPRSVAQPITTPAVAGLNQLNAVTLRNDAIRAGTFNLEQGAALTEDMETAFQTAQRDTPLGEFDAEAFLSDVFDPMADQLGKAAPTDLAARQFQETATRTRANLAIRANAFEAESIGQRGALAFETARDSGINTVLSNPESYSQVLAQMETALLGADEFLPADAIAEYRRETTEKLTDAFVLGEIGRDPFAAMTLLHSGELDDRLAPSDKLSLMSAAAAEQRRRVTASEDAQKPTEAFKESSGRLANDLLLRESTGTLSQQDIEAARPFLTRQDERTVINALGDQITPTTDPLVFANLFERANAGEDITFPASNEFRSGTLSQADYVSLSRMVTSRPQPGTVFERTRKALSDRLQPGPFEQKWDREGAQIRTANALREFDEWVQRNPDASDETYWNQVNTLGERWSSGATQTERASTLPVPMFFQGTRVNPDLDGTQLMINDHFSAKHGGDINAMVFDPDFMKEVEILQQWRDFVAGSQ